MRGNLSAAGRSEPHAFVTLRTRRAEVEDASATWFAMAGFLTRSRQRSVWFQPTPTSTTTSPDIALRLGEQMSVTPD